MTTISVFLDACQSLHHILHRFFTFYFHLPTAREGRGDKGDCNQHLEVDCYINVTAYSSHSPPPPSHPNPHPLPSMGFLCHPLFHPPIPLQLLLCLLTGGFPHLQLGIRMLQLFLLSLQLLLETECWGLWNSVLCVCVHCEVCVCRCVYVGVCMCIMCVHV